jgi:DNA-binding CsgD family transcriptional regulator
MMGSSGLKFAQPQREPGCGYLSTRILDVTYQTNTIGYYALDPYAAMAARRPQMVALLGQELVPPQVVQASEYYHDYGVLFGVCHVMGATVPLHTSASTLLVIAAHRPRDAQAFTDVERQRLNVLLPHLQRAVQLRQRLGLLEAQVQPGFATLDVLSLGVVVVAADSTIMFVNTVAEALTHGDEGLRLAGRCRGLSAVQPLAAQALQQLFALTAAEADVALTLAMGRSADEIALERGVSLPTVRTQIRQILEKTGALHLRDLIRLLTGIPTVRPPGTAP